MSDNIKVVVKVRPLISREIEDKQQPQWRVNNNTLYQLDSSGRDFGTSFTFDKVYCESTKTSDVYNDVAKPIVEAAVAGFNGTIFAYGQTSSGKTYTMTGTDESPGIIPLAVLNLFDIIKKEPGRDFVVSVSYIELYNETLRDLLDLKKIVKYYQTYDGFKVEATQKVTASPDEVLEAMKVGNANRQTAMTKMNEYSSRSHSIFQISIESREHMEGEEQAGCVNVSQLNLVDLAGSERAGQTGATGLRFKEGTAINQSLTSLALVIKQLSESQRYVNYRDSNLTRILQNSLGGNAKTSIICAITPAALEETNSTLQFATRAKAVKNKPELNAVATDATMIQKLTQELSKLKSTLEDKKKLEVMLETKMNVEQDLQKKIENLQRFILNGCNQNPNVELMGGARRKLLPPRRITISTLHPSEEDIPKVPKFSTPSLKYNPSLIHDAAEFMPIESFNKLSSVPEEPIRLITPPPKGERKVNFSDEVIEVDSDDDECPEQSCSPYHECYNATKTPPCVLRKNAKQAERNLKDLVELTDREKMYSPDVVELIEKIEQSSKTTAILQDEIEVLKSASKEKDLEIEDLRSKITSTEHDKNNYTTMTLELETKNKKLSTELTDWQVLYETLKNKFQLREQELLSLLNEQRIKKADDIGKIPFKLKDKEIVHFMDMSKDISLVNSDNESSIVSPGGDDASDRSNILIKDMQAQLAAKDTIIKDLENDIKAQKDQIQLLETSSHDLLSQVASFKEKLSYYESENELLQSTVNELNCTVKSQKENLESVQNDINSYNSVIQELQIKLTKKDNLPDIHIDEAVLERMMTNEDQTLANNENIRNVIHSLRLALDNSKKEADLLRSKTHNYESGDKDYVDELKDKTVEIEMLKAEIAKFIEQVNGNMKLIDSLLREKNDSALAEQELTQKLFEVQNQISEYDNLNKEQALQIDIIKKENKRLETARLADAEQSTIVNETLIKEVREATNRINILEEDIKSKNLEIENLNIKNNEFQDCLDKTKHAINKLQDVFKILSGDVREIPEIFDSFVNVYSYLNDNLNMLEQIAVETISQKELIQNNNEELQNKMNTLVLQHKEQISEALNETANLNRTIHDLTSEVNLLKERNSDQLKEIEILKHELNDKNVELSNFKKQVEAFRETDILKDVITSLKENETVICDRITNLETETYNYASPSKAHEAKDLSEKEEICSQKLNELNDQLEQKCAELTQVKETLRVHQEENEQLIENIIRKLSNVIENIKEKNSSIKKCLMMESSNTQGPNSILSLLDVVVDHIIMQSPMESENEELKREIQIISDYNKSLECDLKQSSELLQQIQKELKIKSSEIDTIEKKAHEFKNQFIDLDLSMKEQMQFLRSENEKLKIKFLDLHNETEMKLKLLEEHGQTSELTSRKSVTKSNAECENIQENALPSLFKLCCSKIIEAIDNKRDINCSMITPTCITNMEPAPNMCRECDQLILELRTTQQENINLTNIVEQLEILNKKLMKEHIDMSEEVSSLVELTQDLEKKTASHRTNLSILTATTYTENTSLKSQVKGLQHHHSRFHNVCQRDIPEFKKQLDELLIILKDDSSFCDAINSSYKRYSLPNLLESNVTSNQTRNESALDGDLLMLDTNVTLTTADNTLVGYNQTCLDSTQNMLNETDCQTVDHNLAETNTLHNQIDILKCNNEDLSAKLGKLIEENIRLKDQVTKYIDDSKTNSMQINKIEDSEKNLREFELLTEQLSIATKEKQDIAQKYNDLLLEMPSTDALVHKLKTTEEYFKNKVRELTKTIDTLNAKSIELKAMQDENDSLSTQIMEHISEIDDLNKEVTELKQQNVKLLEQSQALEVEKKTILCPKCEINDEVLNINSRNDESHSKLNRSLSDSHTTSRHNTICTLRSEIHAGCEDCKVLTEDVVTIKHHLDQSNMSMDLDESLNFELANDSVSSSPHSKKVNMPNIQEQQTLEVYMIDKNDCFKYYLEKTGKEHENLTSDTRILQVMKSLYENVVIQHGNEVENLANKLKDYEESHANLQEQINLMNTDYSKIQKDLDERDNSLNYITKVVTQLKDNLSATQNDTNLDVPSHETYENNLEVLKNKFLTILDKQFNLSSINVLEQIECYTKKLFKDYSSINDVLIQTKQQLLQKENEFNLLKAQNDKIHQINNAVTLDIIKKDEENSNIAKETYQKLIELNMISPDKVSISEPFNIHSLIRLLEHFINEYHKERAKGQHSQEIEQFKVELLEKETQLNDLRSQYEKLHGLNIKNTEDLSKKEEQVKELKALQDELNCALTNKVEENSKHVTQIQNLSEEIYKLKDNISDKEKIIESLHENETRVIDFLNSIKNLEDGNEKLKAANEMISNEAKSYAIELEKSCATIKQNNLDIVRMTSDILVLRQSMKEATAHVETLKQEVKALAEENAEVKQNLEMKTRDCSRLEVNIKTHEKTAEIQSRMIMRLQKTKEEDDKAHSKLTKELNEKYTALQAECEELRQTINVLNEEIELLKAAKQSLEHRLTDAEENGRRSRSSIDAVARRRQSLHDARRQFEETEDHKNLEAVFASRQNDFFDDDLSGRSTPFGLAKGRDSLLSRTDQSDKEEDLSRPSSALTKAARRRRQSSHDLHRSVTPHAPSPDLASYVIDELQQLKTDTSRNRLHSDKSDSEYEISHCAPIVEKALAPKKTSTKRKSSSKTPSDSKSRASTSSKGDCAVADLFEEPKPSEITQLKAQLAAYETELEELKEKNRELDEECDTCAEYLRERETQCARLKKEKAALENQIMELKTKTTPDDSMASRTKPSVAHVAVNTDEDWTNLHSVVVDRMSYDAEVEKNKRLTKTIEELRFTKMELKNTMAKMQKALEKNSAKDNSRELDQMKKQLKASNDELRELRKRYKDLDEECETCANYLKEREEQCRRLTEAKHALEAKLEELQQHSHTIDHTKSLRKKRQTVHDMNRPDPTTDQMDVSTETTNDFLTSQVTREDSVQAANESSRDIEYFKKMVEMLTQQKMQLEMQLRAVQIANPMFVATGSAIVQNQQITDVMKENQKLKKINAKLVNICRKRSKSANRENEDPSEQG